MQFDASVILPEQLLENDCQVFWLVGIVFHDVWGKPDFLDLVFLPNPEDMQGLGHLLYAVVDAW